MARIRHQVEEYEGEMSSEDLKYAVSGDINKPFFASSTNTSQTHPTITSAVQYCWASFDCLDTSVEPKQYLWSLFSLSLHLDDMAHFPMGVNNVIVDAQRALLHYNAVCLQSFVVETAA